MNRDIHKVQRSIAVQAQHSDAQVPLATRCLVDFLREQIVEAEWQIARAQTEIEAYEQAIEAIQARERPTN